MATNDNKRYYWLKLEEDFFKRHDIRIIESMPNGKDYILFYLKLLCESTSHEGYLRFSKTIPYNEEMLSTITNTNVDIVRSAVKVFTELKMMSILDDGTLYFEQVQKMIGSETGQTVRKREAKERLNAIEGKVGVKNTLEIDIDIDKDIEKEIDIDKEYLDKTRYNLIKASSNARSLLQLLYDYEFLPRTEEDIQGYLKLFDDLLTTYEYVDVKIKLTYILQSISRFDRDSCRWIYNNSIQGSKYQYLVIALNHNLQSKTI